MCAAHKNIPVITPFSTPFNVATHWFYLRKTRTQVRIKFRKECRIAVWMCR
jgi:hypothetical protein